jgi:ubiquitin carboxyl-terminal hydrolase 4/11/15
MFDICVTSTGEPIPTGWNAISENSDFTSIKTRITKPIPHRPRQDDSFSSAEESGSISSEGDVPDVDYAGPSPESAESAAESDGSETIPSLESDVQEHTMQKSKGRNKRKKNKNYKTKHRSFFGKLKSQPRPQIRKQPSPAAEGPGLIKPGEAIILDWDPQAYEILFGGTENPKDAKPENESKGAPTWKSVAVLPDPGLKAKREERNRRKKNGITLDECLNEFAKSETLSEQNAWLCPRCKERRRAEKKFELWKCPDILVMHLKRFSSNRNFRDKLEVRVDYPIEGLDLTNVVHETEGKSMIYDLIAVDNHYGGLGGGHYTAYAKHFGNGNWYEYNGKCKSGEK